MPKTLDHTAPLRFRGSPHSIEAFVPGASLDAGDRMLGADLDIELAEGKKPPIELHPIPGGTTATRLRLVLPKSTPPGTYKGTLRFGESHYPIVAEVEPYAHLRLSPRRLALEAKAGSEAEIELTLVNNGNVTCEVGKAYVFGLFDQDGLNRSTATAFLDESARGRERTDRLMDELADGYGGIVRMKVEAGTGPVAPGEFRNLRLKLRFPDHLHAGRGYFGTWSFHNLTYLFTVRVTGAEAAKEV